MTSHKESLTDFLKALPFPLDENARTLQELGLIESINVEGSKATCVVSVPFPQNDQQKEILSKFQNDTQRLLTLRFSQLDVLLVLTHHHAQGAIGEKPEGLQGVKNIILVASGKGGVGKSTIAVNLALALSHLGQRVGLLDADIYGPSLPRLLNIKNRPHSPDGKVMDPIEKEGVKCMSMGFLVDESEPIIWRGPMIQGVLHQLLNQVTWGKLDVLVIDMPPGTGDTHLTITQKIPISGAVIVSTPQDLALIDARKAIGMFEKMKVPILGIIENMSFFHCPSCAHETPIFSQGGAKREAETSGFPYLGSLPLMPELCAASDQGIPLHAKNPNHPAAQIFATFGKKVIEALNSKA